jgi:hypothetical protein
MEAGDSSKNVLYGRLYRDETYDYDLLAICTLRSSTKSAAARALASASPTQTIITVRNP